MVTQSLADDDGALAPAARWWLRPLAARTVTLHTRALQLAVVLAVLTWVFGYLGGLGFSPRPLGGGANDTGPIFNWHPLLLTAAFPLLMAEAVLAYKAPLVEIRDRCGWGPEGGEGEARGEGRMRDGMMRLDFSVPAPLLPPYPPCAGLPPSCTTLRCTRQRSRAPLQA